MYFYDVNFAVALGDSCSTDDECTNTVTNSECVDEADPKTCTCVEGYTQQDADCKANKGIGDVCSTTDDICTTVGTACVADGGSTSTTKCLCNGDYVANANNNGCLKNKGIGDVCSTTDDICTTVGTACVADGGSTSTTKCLCNGDYVANANNNGCLKKIDVTCDAESQCVANAECSDTCQCLTDFTSNADKTKCLNNLGTSCESTSVCAADGVCDINSDSPTCAIGSGGSCDADSKCVAHSECTEKTCTCTNGDADETSKLCPSRGGGLRETSSVLVVTVCLWLNLF
ncbi:prion-like-(Q/N-rich) domain-bearing protein 25 [Mya arenaria]|uniref:prion-like-(Q/N-rich) domain-bearing protein 25 n=1 Tax=Mya arenaria TaxID=6604 RepID=UPI0022E16919|nr:prion-like-(Q/N-rich) domain-bearing protein 25 [Mya arenaria]